MAIVKEGDTIRVHYTGKFEDGTVFDSSEGGASLEVRLGESSFIPGFEEGVIGMSTGETKTIFIPMEKGYGLRNKDMVFEFDRSKAPENFNPQVGQQLQMYRADGVPVMVTVVALSEKSVTMDCNHPLAGKNLIFDITLEEIL